MTRRMSTVPFFFARRRWRGPEGSRTSYAFKFHCFFGSFLAVCEGISPQKTQPLSVRKHNPLNRQPPKGPNNAFSSPSIQNARRASPPPHSLIYNRIPAIIKIQHMKSDMCGHRLHLIPLAPPLHFRTNYQLFFLPSVSSTRHFLCRRRRSCIARAAAARGCLPRRRMESGGLAALRCCRGCWFSGRGTARLWCVFFCESNQIFCSLGQF
jgi:hypothetical protein